MRKPTIQAQVGTVMIAIRATGGGTFGEHADAAVQLLEAEYVPEPNKVFHKIYDMGVDGVIPITHQGVGMLVASRLEKMAEAKEAA